MHDICVYASLCVCVSVCEYGIQKSMLGVYILPPFFWDKFSSCMWSSSICIAWLSNKPLDATCLHQNLSHHLSFRCTPLCCSTFIWGARNLNSDSDVWSVGILPSEPSPQSLMHCFFKTLNVSINGRPPLCDERSTRMSRFKKKSGNLEAHKFESMLA